jgi:hypothetical protein
MQLLKTGTDRRSLRPLEGASPFNPCWGEGGVPPLVLAALMLLSSAAARAGTPITQLTACCDALDATSCPTSVEVAGPGSVISPQGTAATVHGVWTLTCEDGAAFFAAARRSAVGAEDGRVMSSFDPAAAACYAAACSLPPRLCVENDAQGVLIVDCATGAPADLAAWSSPQLAQRTPVIVGNRAVGVRIRPPEDPPATRPTTVAASPWTAPPATPSAAPRPSQPAATAPVAAAPSAIASLPPARTPTTTAPVVRTPAPVERSPSAPTMPSMSTSGGRAEPTAPITTRTTTVSPPVEPARAASPRPVTSTPEPRTTAPSLADTRSPAPSTPRTNSAPSSPGSAPSSPASTPTRPTDPAVSAFQLPPAPPNPCVPDPKLRDASLEQADLGDEALLRADSGAALGHWRAALLINPCNAHVWSSIGSTLAGNDRAADAERALTTATRLMPTNLRAWTELGRAREALAMWNEAVAAYHEALSLSAGYAPAEEGLRRASRQEE